MPPAEIPKIFLNIEQLLSVNAELLTKLDICLEKGLDPNNISQTLIDLSKIFIDIVRLTLFQRRKLTTSEKKKKQSKDFKVYANYCTHNPTAIETLTRVSKNPAYIAFEDVRE